jgi:hypothetical protein
MKLVPLDRQMPRILLFTAVAHSRLACLGSGHSRQVKVKVLVLIAVNEARQG